MNRRLTFIDLFAGIGGFRRGMELAGHKCMGFCEWDKFATASYLKQLEMEINSGLWIKESESELHCKEGINRNMQYIEWLKELKDLREENKVLIRKCDRLINEKGADVQPVKHGRWETWGYVFHGIAWKRCSVCGKTADVSYQALLDGKIEMATPSICGCCGARMDMGGDSDE